MIFILTSFGAGVALGARPDISQAVSIAQRNIERQASQRAAEASAREKEFDEFAKDMEDFVIDPTKFHPLFIKPLQLAGVKMKNAAMEAQAINPQNYRNTDIFQKAFFKWQKEKADATIGTKTLAEVEEIILKNPKGLIINEDYEIITKALETGDFKTALATFGKSFTTERFVSFEQEEINLIEDLRLNLSPLFERAKETGKVAIPQPDGSIKTVTTTELTEEDAFNLANVHLLNPDIKNSVEATFSRLTPEQQEEFKTPENWYRENLIKPFIDAEVGTTLTKPRVEKVKKGWNINTGGWNNKKYAFGYSLKETTDPVSGAQKKEETINLEYLGTPDLSKLEINIKRRPLLGRITLFEVQDGKVIMSYKTTEKHPDIPETQEEGAVVIKVPFEGKVKKEVETKYQFDFDAMINEVRGLQGEGAIEYTNQRTGKDKAGNSITIGLKEGKWFNITTGEILK